MGRVVMAADTAIRVNPFPIRWNHVTHWPPTARVRGVPDRLFVTLHIFGEVTAFIDGRRSENFQFFSGSSRRSRETGFFCFVWAENGGGKNLQMITPWRA